MPAVFVYGPDTFRGRTFDRIGLCDVIGSATLDGHTLVFDKPNMKNKAEGLPNIAAAEGEVVLGVLFDLTRKQMETFEGYFGGYSATEVKVKVRKSGDTIPAVTFVARRTGRNLGPSQANLDLAIKGAEENAFPRDFIEHLKALKSIDE